MEEDGEGDEGGCAGGGGGGAGGSSEGRVELLPVCPSDLPLTPLITCLAEVCRVYRFAHQLLAHPHRYVMASPVFM